MCVPVCALCLYPAIPGWAVRCGCVCLGSGCRCAPPLLAGLLGCVCACVCALLVARDSWLGCAVSLCVLGLGFRLRPATPGWGVGMCVCLCLHSASAPPLLAGVCGVDVCAWAQVLAAPRHCWRGCWGLCVFVCTLRLNPATPGWGLRCGCVWLGSRFGCAPLLLAGFLGCVCVCLRAPLVPRHSWLGCAVWVCVLGHEFRLCPATPGWGVGVSVCLCARSACTPPLLAGMCRVSVCVWARVSAAPRHPRLGGLGCVCVCVRAPLVPRHSWLGRAVRVCVLGLGFQLRPAIPGWGVGVCVCLFARSVCTPTLLAGVCRVSVCVWAQVLAAPRHSQLGCWGVCVFVCALRLHPATPGWSVPCGCVCLDSGFGCAPPSLAGVLGCVCVCVRAPFVPRHSWLGCAVWVCLPRLGSRLRPATPGWGVGVCVCLCAHSVCTPPLLAGLCGVDVRAWARVSAPPRHSWLGCWGVCVCVRALFVPRHFWLGCAVGCVCLGSGFGCGQPLLVGVLGCVCVPVCALHFNPATPGSGVRFGCACYGLAFRCAPPLLAGVLGCVCVSVCTPLVPYHSCPGCAAWVCVLGLGFQLRPDTAGLVYFLAKRLALVFIMRPKGITHFYLSIGLSKKG